MQRVLTGFGFGRRKLISRWTQRQVQDLRIEKFESEHYQLNAATPQSILLYLMEERNMIQSELADLFGSKGVASEILSGKRSISK